jgi:hypothetical protein
MEHRLERERQVVAALGKGLASADVIAREIYPRNLKKSLRRTAERNVATHLEKLVSEGKVAGTSASFKLIA